MGAFASACRRMGQLFFSNWWRIAATGLGAIVLAACVFIYWAPYLLLSHMQSEDLSRWPAARVAQAPISDPQGAMHEVASPDGAIVFSVIADPRSPIYKVHYRGREIIKPSRLGFAFAGEAPLQTGLSILDDKRTTRDATWEQPWGEARYVRDHHNEMRLTLAETGGAHRQFVMVVRVFDDGVGFRFEFPPVSDGSGARIVSDEKTEFVLGGNWKLWWLPAWGKARDEYVTRSSAFTQVLADPLARGVHTPLTIESGDGVVLSIHEAALENYSAMVLAPQPGNLLRAQLVPWSNGDGPHVIAPFHTPWRSIEIGQHPSDLINSRLILNLNEPARYDVSAYVKPMKYVGIWWGYITHYWDRVPGPRFGSTTARAKQYIDFAAANGFGGVLIESWNKGWEKWPAPDGRAFSFTQDYPEFNLKEVAAYARSKGVQLIGHHETNGDIAHYEAHIEDAFALDRDEGIHVVKTGYVAPQPGLRRVEPNGKETREWQYSQYMVAHESRIAALAHQYQIAIVAHEADKDTGLRRTYPNFMSREAARGQEYNGFDAVLGGNPPAHEPTIAFTRMLSGPMDFTPGIFDVDFSELKGMRGFVARWLVRSRVNTTLTKQLALYVVLYSPMQMAADFIENYEAQPQAFEFIKAVPTDWDQSIALDGEIGQYVVMARKDRHGDDWYLGAVTNEQSRREVQPLDFLDDGITYEATIWSDAKDADWKRNPEAYDVSTRKVRKGDKIELVMARGGGEAIRLRPILTD